MYQVFWNHFLLNFAKSLNLPVLVRLLARKLAGVFKPKKVYGKSLTLFRLDYRVDQQKVSKYLVTLLDYFLVRKVYFFVRFSYKKDKKQSKRNDLWRQIVGKSFWLERWQTSRLDKLKLRWLCSKLRRWESGFYWWLYGMVHLSYFLANSFRQY